MSGPVPAKVGSDSAPASWRAKVKVGTVCFAVSAQHTPPRTLVGSVMMKNVSLSTDLQCEEQEMSDLEESAPRRLHKH